jgi:hypothetical protein
MIRKLAIVLSVSVLAYPAVMANDQNLNAAVGGALGGGLGALVGNVVGGRTGAIVGGGLGGAAGAAVSTHETRSYPPPRYYPERGDWAPENRYPYRRGGFCPPGQAKKGNC